MKSILKKNDKKNFLIFQTAEPTHFENDYAPMRLISLADFLINNGHKVTIITTLFFHQKKKFRNFKTEKKYKINGINYFFITSPGYFKNISFKRLFDHFILANNLKKKLNSIKNIDYVFIGFPPIETSYVLSSWCYRNNIPYTLDFKDDWPEIFFYKRNFFFKLIFYPAFIFLRYLKNLTIIKSKNITGISKKFLPKSKKLSKIIKNKYLTLYLTKDIKKKINLNNVRYEIKKLKDNKKKMIIFIGNFYESAYDFEILIKIKEFIIKNNSFEFLFFGDGPGKEHLIKILNFKNIKIYNSVNIDEKKLIMLISSAVFLPFISRPDMVNSLPNKIIDAIQYKLPIITSLHGEAAKIIKKKKIGCVYNDHYQLKNILNTLFKSNVYLEMKKNYNSADINNEFDHLRNYEKILLNL